MRVDDAESLVIDCLDFVAFACERSWRAVTRVAEQVKLELLVAGRTKMSAPRNEPEMAISGENGR